MIKKTRDMATVFTDVYSCVAPKMLKEQHEFLLNSLENHFKDISNGSLVVLGPGGLVLPYSMQYDGQNLGKTNRKKIKKILKKGRAVFVDYVLSAKHGGLEKQLDTLKKMGFFEENYFLKGAFNPGKISNIGPGPETLSFLLNNARDPLKIDDDFADAVDANLSLHHTYVNRAELDRLCKELYRVIKPGGMLHLGEGNVDMNYSEDKTIQLATDLSRILNKSIVVTDDREKDSEAVRARSAGRRHHR